MENGSFYNIVNLGARATKKYWGLAISGRLAFSIFTDQIYEVVFFTTTPSVKQIFVRDLSTINTYL